MMNYPYGRAMSSPYGGYPGYPQGMGMQAGQQAGQQQMNGTVPPSVPSGTTITGPMSVPSATQTGVNVQGLLPAEQSFIENILRLNLGKVATIYMTFENNSEWNAKIFKGRLEAAGRDHIIISDPRTGMRYLLLMVNLDYVTFDEPLNYTYPYGGGTSAQSQG